MKNKRDIRKSQPKPVKIIKMTDTQNPAYLFQTIGSDILCAIVNNKIDAVQLAREELAARGLNHSGQWVGFDMAEKIAKGGMK